MESRVLKRTVLSGVDPDERIGHIRNYQVYRGLSPATSSRYEIRIRELEDALEAEREMRLRAERGFTELSIEAGSLSDKLDEADGWTSAQLESMRRRDQEILKLRKELELLQMQSTTNEAGLKKRHQDVVALLTSQLEAANKHKSKGEDEKTQLHIQIDMMSNQYDAASKGKMHAEGKLESMEDQLRRLKAHNEELTRQNSDLNATKVKQAADLIDLQKQLHDLEVSYNHVIKIKNQLQSALDEAKSKLEDDTRLRAQLANQLHALQSDFDLLTARYEEEVLNSTNLKGQLQKTLSDLQLVKNKYESDLLLRTTELDDLRRKSGGRILELEEQFDQARNRVASLEKEKIRLNIEIRDYSSQLDMVNASNMDLGKKLKGFEGSSLDLQKRFDEMTLELSNLSSDHQRDQAELAKLRNLSTELADKNDHLARENKHLTDSLREALSNNNDLARQVQELNMHRTQLLAERDALAVELADTKEALKDALSKLDFLTQSLSQVKSDLERRLREKEDELEIMRKTGQKVIDDLQRSLVDTEVKFKNELSRLKKKYENDMRDLQGQLEGVSRVNVELSRTNKSLSNRVKELEMLLEEERRTTEETRQAAANWERRFIAVHTEFENLQAQFDLAEKARKGLEAEMGDSSGRMKELTITINTLGGEKRRFESECHALRVEMDGLLGVKKAAEDKAERLQGELNRMADQLRAADDAAKKSEADKRRLEAEVKELRMRLDELEAIGGKDAKIVIGKLEIRLRELEHELEAERRRSKDMAAEHKKLMKLYQELKISHDNKQNKLLDLTSLVEQLSAKNKQLRRQIEEVEEVVGITIGKYRKGQQQVEDAQRRADNVEHNNNISRLSPLRVVTPVVASVSRGLGLGLSGSHLTHHRPIRASSVSPMMSSYHPIGGRSLSVSREVRRVGRY